MKYAAILALLACGCSPAAQNARSRTALESRAAFDLHCPQSSLAVSPLGMDAHGVITSYGVEGCGRRATYVRLADSTWLMNSPPITPAPAGVPRRPVPVPPPPSRPVRPPSPPAPSAEPAPPPSGSVERSPEQPPSSLKPGERAPRLPDLPGQGERPSPLDHRR